MVHRLITQLRHFANALLADNQVVYHYEGDGYVSTVRMAERGPLIAFSMLILLVLVFPARVWLVVVIAMALLVGFCFVWAVQGARRMRLNRQLLHAWAQVGDRLQEDFVLQNDSPLPIVSVEITDHSTLPGYDNSEVRAVAGRGSTNWNRVAISTRRGIFQLGPTTARFGDPLGIFEVIAEYTRTREVLVVPPVLHNLSVVAPAGGGYGVMASRQRDLAETSLIGGVRDYHAGDPIRRVHWPLSMRHQSLLVKEFDDEKGSDIWLTLDLDQAVHVGEGQESTLEYAIIWTASWAWHLLKQGKGVGLYTSNPERVVIHPGSGMAHLGQILRALASLEARAEVPLSTLLSEVRPFLARGHSLIVFTPSSTSDWPVKLMQPGLQTAIKGVVLLDAVTFDQGETSAELATGAESPASSPRGGSVAWLRTMLASMGVPVHLVQFQKDLDVRSSAPGSGDWDHTITPWGKVAVQSSPVEVQS